ncbi:MAG: hypothetical protein EOM20_03830 [Spartobacteria bacterium]|nr:hypothetical protein [Spartobacteria bacterium]
MNKNVVSRLLVLLGAPVAGMLLCSCASIRPLETVEAVRAFDYDGMILGGRPDRGLSLAIAKNEAGPHVIDVMLKNESDRRLCVNSHFVVDLGQYDASPNLFLLIERASNGERLSPSKKSWTLGGRSSRASMFKVLEPHEYHKLAIDLSDYFALQRGEDYCVTAEYDNQETGYKKGSRWIEMYAWVGRIKSNRLLLK